MPLEIQTNCPTVRKLFLEKGKVASVEVQHPPNARSGDRVISIVERCSASEMNENEVAQVKTFLGDNYEGLMPEIIH